MLAFPVTLLAQTIPGDQVPVDAIHYQCGCINGFAYKGEVYAPVGTSYEAKDWSRARLYALAVCPRELDGITAARVKSRG